MIERDVDILVVGGGLTGAIMLLALAQLGVNALLIDAHPLAERTQADFDARSLALSPASVQILKMLAIWPLLQAHATAIETIHVSEQNQWGRTLLNSKEDEPLGYVVEMQDIQRVLAHLLDSASMMAHAKLVAFDPQHNIATVQQFDQQFSVRAQVVVAADGADSAVRQFCKLPVKIKDYAQSALVANIGLLRPHQHIAYERFTPSGPMALLPMSQQRTAMVWSLAPQDADQLMAVAEDEFLARVQRTIGYRLGRLSKVGKRVLYPLRQVIMKQTVLHSIVFIGNAAHTLHPVAGQGFNLGLRDVAMLAQCIVEKGLTADMLQHYQQVRQYDHTTMAWLTDGLVELFTKELPGFGLARGTALALLDNAPFLKTALMRYARGYAGEPSDLACGIPLPSRVFAHE